MQLWQIIEAALVRFAREVSEPDAVVCENGEWFFDPVLTPTEEVHLTALAKELATAINIKRD